MGKLKITYVALDPLKYPRIEKISSTLSKFPDVQFDVFMPKIRLVWPGNFLSRMISAFINYFAITFQLLFYRSDIYWVANCPDVLALPLIIAGKRYVLEYRSPWPLEVEREFGSGPWVKITAFFESLALSKAMFITLTTSKLLGRVRYCVPIFVIPNYPTKEFELSDFSKNEFRVINDCGPDQKIVLFVGKLSRVEGADILLDVIDGVLARTSDVFFWIVGDGPMYSTLAKSTAKHGKKVVFFGWKPHSEIPFYISASDVCISPRHEFPYSEYYNEEGLQKISEYMYYERPIVACGIAESDEYLLVAEDEMVEGVLSALKGNVAPSRRRTWEQDSVRGLHDLIDAIWKSLF